MVIAACGEALVDLMPDPRGEELVRHPILGGSAYNVAMGIARLGGRVAYAWELSTDEHGVRYMAALRASGVDVTAVRRSERPTPVAIVDLSGPEPIYRITDVGRVLHDIVPPDPPPGTRCLVVGSAVLAHQPVAGAIEALCARAPVLAIDYNVRQPSITDAAAYTARLERLSRRAGIVKASVADLAMIGEADGPAYMRRMVREGAALAVLTDGPRGAHAWSGAASASVPAPAVEVIDSVGAGDAFMAALLAALQAEDALSHEALGALGGETLECHLVMAQRVAAASCTKRGAHMPFAAELCL